MSGQFAIRRMRAADIDRVVEIAAGRREAPQWQRGVYLTAIDPEAVPLRAAFVAEDREGVIAGFAVASITAPEAELETIAVAARFERRGIARRLFDQVQNALRDAEVKSALLEVRASNFPALGLYRSLGFEETGRRPRYYADPVEDAVLMSKQVV
jgi:[ribosomal protein S18]-alanine N-acetyltransferase